jgi:hypothetical protein
MLRTSSTGQSRACASRHLQTPATSSLPRAAPPALPHQPPCPLAGPDPSVRYDETRQKLSKKFAVEASSQEKALLARIEQHEAEALPAIAKAAELWLANKAEDATRVMIKEIRPVQKKWMEALDQLAALEDAQNGQSQLDAEAAFASARNFMLVLLALRRPPRRHCSAPGLSTCDLSAWENLCLQINLIRAFGCLDPVRHGGCGSGRRSARQLRSEELQG